MGHHATAFSDFLEPTDEEAMARDNYDMPSILDGIRSLAGQNVTVAYARGCALLGGDRRRDPGGRRGRQAG